MIMRGPRYTPFATRVEINPSRADCTQLVPLDIRAIKAKREI